MTHDRLIAAADDDGTGVPRRAILRRAGMGMGWLGAMTMLASRHRPARAEQVPTSLDVRPPHFAPRARALIHIFANGGPSHIDTFDPKPVLETLAGRELPASLKTERRTGTVLPSPFRFAQHGQSGLSVSELFPQVARHADRLLVVRSMHAEVPNHEPSLLLMNCGDGRLPRPSVGAWVTYGLGSENQNLPGFVAMCPGGYPVKATENWQSGFLPGAFQATYIDTKQAGGAELIEHVRHPLLDPAVQRRGFDLTLALDRRHAAARTGATALEARLRTMELAWRMQSDASEAFDLSREPAHVRARYGDTPHGRQLLLARRLVERGVRYVQVWHGEGQPWDSHGNLEKNHRKLAGQADGPIGALLDDLVALGLLESTLVLWGGEFGRTPVAELANDVGGDGRGRDHNHHGFTVWMAGGGVKAGSAYGATDEFGFKAVDKPVHVHDLHATLLHLLGLDHTRLTFRHAGRDFRLTDVHGRVIDEFLA
jgi:hypothetical protein